MPTAAIPTPYSNADLDADSTGGYAFSGGVGEKSPQFARVRKS